jgi:hypothetical protein
MLYTSEWPYLQLGTRRVSVNTGDGLVHTNGTAFRPTGTTFHSPVVSNAPPCPGTKVLHSVFSRSSLFIQQTIIFLHSIHRLLFALEGRCSLLSTNRIFMYTAMRPAQSVALDTVLPAVTSEMTKCPSALNLVEGRHNSDTSWAVYHVTN